MKQLSKHLTFANVISCIALFMALSGAAFAAKTTLGNKAVKTKNLANGSVTALKLRNGSVTSLKLANGAVTGLKLAPGAVGSTQIANGAVRSAALGGSVVTNAKLKDEAVGTGKIAVNSINSSKLLPEAVTTDDIKVGAVTEGLIAPAYRAQLVKNIAYAAGSSGFGPSPNFKTAVAECVGPGKTVVGGGVRVIGANDKVALVESAPGLDSAGKRTLWTASANEFADETEAWGLEAFAICAEF